jgi:hypothetical protein
MFSCVYVLTEVPSAPPNSRTDSRGWLLFDAVLEKAAPHYRRMPEAVVWRDRLCPKVIFLLAGAS